MQNTTTARTVNVRPLSALDLDFLSRIPSEEWSLRAVSPEAAKWWPVEEVVPAPVRAAEWTGARVSGFSCVIAYEGEFGISLGVARCRRPAGTIGLDEDVFEVSPFPGGWETVRLSQIVSVRGTTEI